MAENTGVEVEFVLDGLVVAPDPAVAAVAVDHAILDRWGPWLPGMVREALTSAAGRKGLGVHHTPPDVVAEVLDHAERTGLTWDDTTTVLDPSVGGGAFLLAAAERLPGDRAAVIERLAGVDIDPLAVATTIAALTLWAGVAPSPTRFVVGDFLAIDPWPDPVDVVVGNPPFLSQLRAGTARSDDRRAWLAERWPGVGRYVDDAMAFALASVDATRTGGAVVLIQPTSVLGATDAEPVRARLAETAPLAGLWVDRARRFAASVDTVAIVLRPGVRGGSVRVGEHTVVGPAAASWAPLLATATGTPTVVVDSTRTLGDVAHVTAGFRDQFYGLRGAVDDDPTGTHPLVTSGSIDPLRLRWGERVTRFDKRPYRHPVVELDRVEPGIRSWVDARLVPKVLVASQTKVIEALIDDAGVLVPGTPVVSVEPSSPEIGTARVAALLTSPVASARLAAVAAGTALSADSVRVSARLLADLPLPIDDDAWGRAAERATAGDVLGCGRAMLVAHGLGDRSDILEWWTGRMPTNSLGN
ncbi:MAG: N-6 DNA methylase [Actinomycetota bacterium]